MPILEKFSAGKQLLILLIILVFSLFIFTPLGIILAVPFVTDDIFTAIGQMEFAKTAQDIALLKYFQIISQIGLFIASSFFFARLVSDKPFSFLGLNKSPKITLLGIAFIISLVSTPLLDWIIELNNSVHLPASLAPLENWMRQMETEAARLMMLFLNSKGITSLMVNFFMMAVLAGLGEELLLRGLVQPLFIKITKNPHIGIWLAAALFSLMHFQFFGFVPRMLLGALFGYYYYWTRILWIPIIAHIFNNGVIIIYSFFVGTEDLLPKLGAENVSKSPSFLLLLLSLSLSIGGLMFFYRAALKHNEQR